MTEPDFAKARDLLTEGAEKLKDFALAASELAEWLERIAKGMRQ